MILTFFILILTIFITKNGVENVEKSNQMLPGHGCFSHFLDSLSAPRDEQSFPPFCGDGWVQDRDRTSSPTPQFFEHSDQVDHCEYPP